MSSGTLPPVSELLSGFAFNNSPPGTPLQLTYYFETSAPAAGSWANDPTWTPMTAAEQTYVQQAMANVSAFANVTFTQVYSTAQLNYGNSSSQELIGNDFGRTDVPTPENPVAYTAFNGAYFNPTPYFPTADDEYLATHELGNALGLLDYYAVDSWTLPAQYTNSDYTTMAGETYNTSHNAPPDFENPVGFQMLDIAALQYLYGVNENGYTPSYPNTTATLAGSDLTYSITDNSADETIWVGSNVTSVKCLDFSACTSPVAINLNAGAFSSSFVGPAIASGYAAGGNDAIAIALNTVINVGVSNNQASTLIADSTLGDDDVLLGGTGNDSFTAGGGKDIFIGGGGIDTAIFHDAAADYSIDRLGAGVMVVTDNAPVPADGTVVLDGSFTSLQFADQTVTEAANLSPPGLTDVVSAPEAVLSANMDAIDYLVGEGEVSLAVLCFCANTLILTPSGERRVQELAIGDEVITHLGKVRPIIWIGVGSVLATRGRRSAATPVIVRKGALASNVPHRDLRVTKAHSLFVDGALIPVEFLVNHRSVLWDDHAQEVKLYHIELESHDVLLANGAPAESYRDDGNRWLFKNANSGWGLPPQEPCAPVLTGGPIVDKAWKCLLERSGPRPTVPLTDDADLHVLADGKRLDAARRQGEAYRFHLPKLPSELRIASRAAAPAELGIARDPRVLGVAIRKVVLHKAARLALIDAEDDRLADGFHGYEPDEGVRWTSGDATLPPELLSGFTGPLELELHVTGRTQYPLPAGKPAQRAT